MGLRRGIEAQVIVNIVVLMVEPVEITTRVV